MIVALSIALSSIALGALLGLLPGNVRRSGSPFHTFAMVMSVAVVLGQLLPEALGELGIAALAAFAVGFAAPRFAERLASYFSRPACLHDDAMCTDLGLELGYLGLILHHIGDGIGLGLYTGPLHEGHGHYDVLAALAGHTVPLTALVVLAFRTHRGPIDAALRAVGIALSTMLGMALASLLTAEQLESWSPWLTAIVGGLLLHVVAHGWPDDPSPTRASRMMDFAALGAGVVLLYFGGHNHAGDHDGHELHGGTAHALLELGLEIAPTLLLGLGIAAWLQTQGARIAAGWLRGAGALRGAVRGALSGAPLPLCACGVLPVAHSLRARGATAATIVAFVLATPALGVETFALTAQLFGWPFACLRLAGGVLVAVAAGWAMGRLAGSAAGGEGAAAPDLAASLPPPPPAAGLTARVFANFDELLHHLGAWTVIGLLAAAYLQTALPDHALDAMADSGADLLAVTVLAVPSYLCASAATPLAAVLLAKGFSPGAVLCGLLLGPATNLATVSFLRASFGSRATALGIAALLVSTWALALGTNAIAPWHAAGLPAAAADHGHGPLSYASAGVLLLLLARAIWRRGLRSFLGALGQSFTQGGVGLSAHGAPQPAHSHDHGHAHHDHAHHHAH